ncbi:hypothetical protein PV08_11672 [Exophiala spinifera]|uniref:Heterokaryon incompatibility domain-containing protein n=1 Tax=Exophiala spinifera TaxID=91928 RepID=A0A0D2AVF1_9EURO|nr:uncharacterized protein PV08_11672 [Exophiala spinifera]KIW10708.1 hypothetical protein PV08_11672 [Exophiala spinifera]
MRLLKYDDQGTLSLTEDLHDHIPPYAILSHTWAEDQDEVTFDDLKQDSFQSKAGYAKIRFCGEQARKDGLDYFWVDTCCINKANNTEYSEAINSMFRWYRDATQCYVYLSDVPVHSVDGTKRMWEIDFRKSRWFCRGWTLQELLAPASVEFFSKEGALLGSKSTLEQQVHEITRIPIAALRATPLTQFSVDERLGWAAERVTKKTEDQAYCLFGIFDVFMPLIYGEGANALVRLRKKIDKTRKSTSVESGNIHWMVPRSSNTLFTGREEILESLERNVRAAVQHGSRTYQCRIAISGLGGQGKSEICLQLAQRVQSLLWGIFWVDVSTPSQAENGFLDIASRLQISASTWEDGRQGLANIRQPWMLVLDNADDPNVDYQAYFPPSTCGVVVLTSRNAECGQYATTDHVALEGLPTEEATELLLKAANVIGEHRPRWEDDARRVAVLLQSHPLALIQAGAYVKRGHCRLGDYPRVYERQRKRLLGFRPSQAQSRYRDVYATFEASVEILQTSPTELSRDALELLPLLAVCGPSRLPSLVFDSAWKGAQRIVAREPGDPDGLGLTTWHVSQLPSLIPAHEDGWDSFRLVEAVNMLKAFALVSMDVDEEHTCVSMHPLVHAWARDRQDEWQQHASWVAMGCIVALSQSESEMWRVHGRDLQPHLHALTSWEMGCAFQNAPRTAVASVWMECGWLLHGMRDDGTVFRLLERLCTHLGLDKSTVNMGWVALYDLIGRNLVNYGKVQAAVRVLEEVARIQGQTLLEDHPSRLASQHALAGAYEANGQVKDAVRLLEEVVRIKGQTLAEDHPSRLASQHALAGAYQANGQVKDAVWLLEEVVRIRGQTLAEDHPDRLASQHALAGAYEANGQVKDAVQLLEEVLLEEVVRIKGQTLAEDHPDRLASQHNLAVYLWGLGQESAALEMMRQVVEIRQRVLDNDHPSRIASEKWLQHFEDKRPVVN